MHEDDRKEQLLQKAIEFLEAESTAPEEAKIAFLKSKGLTDAEIQTALSAWKVPRHTIPIRDKKEVSLPPSTPPMVKPVAFEIPPPPPALPDRPSDSFKEQSLYPPRPSLITRAILLSLFGGSSLIASISITAV
jgi:hypothetical protein